MTTIREKINQWAQRTLSNSALSSNEQAYNHVQKAVQELQEEPWAQLVLQADMDISNPAAPAAPAEQPTQ